MHVIECKIYSHTINFMRLEFSWSCPLLYPSDLEVTGSETTKLGGGEEQGRGLSIALAHSRIKKKTQLSTYYFVNILIHFIWKHFK